MEVVVAASQMQISTRDQNSRYTSVRTRLLSRRRWGINQMTTLRWSFEEDLRHYRSAEIARIGLSRMKISECGQRRAARLLRESGLSCSSLSWAGWFTGSNGFDYRESIDDATEAIETASEIGAPLVTLVTGGRGVFTPGHSHNLVVESLKNLGEKANRSGIRLAVQPMHKKFSRTTSLVSDIAEGLSLVKRVDHPNVGLVIDLFAMGPAESFFELLPEAVPFTFLVSLSDSPENPSDEYDRVPLGQGVLPVIPTILKLEQAGYSGEYEYQSLSEMTWKMDYEGVIRDTAAFFDQMIVSQGSSAVLHRDSSERLLRAVENGQEPL